MFYIYFYFFAKNFATSHFMTDAPSQARKKKFSCCKVAAGRRLGSPPAGTALAPPSPLFSLLSSA